MFKKITLFTVTALALVTLLSYPVLATSDSNDMINSSSSQQIEDDFNNDCCALPPPAWPLSEQLENSVRGFVRSWYKILLIITVIFGFEFIVLVLMSKRDRRKWFIASMIAAFMTYPVIVLILMVRTLQVWGANLSVVALLLLLQVLSLPLKAIIYRLICKTTYIRSLKRSGVATIAGTLPLVLALYMMKSIF